ncbi:Golgi integral membrane protein 4 isoform X2 [Xenopus laevis]|uniref:Golgi integral membrane protein 4 n=2 Tax=Xenopus laevis TaxID=8355 RepID=A0A974CVQ7_XENLA|nr:Golgi integral membrane protein 4 isoform X2 [Xenopus laevis]OCT80799.1 hypothetical protein XELAEV_18027612mg [Xenopus laevis]
MGNGMCSRRQKRIFQALACLAVAIGFIYGAVLNYHLQNELKKAEAVSLKYQQHHESISAQLQVVYEHRSRLEKSLQKERLEHKKAKEDFLVYKLEAQETLNKGRQDSNNRYSALTVQHEMLKSQHEELRKQHSELQAEHQKLGEDLTKTYSSHKEKYLLLQQEKEQEHSKLKESIYNLREENKQLRKAHQDVHIQLQDVKQQHKNLLSEHEQVALNLENHKSALAAAQGQVEEFMQLKKTLNKMSSLRQPEKATVPTEQNNSPTIVPTQEHATEQEPTTNVRQVVDHDIIIRSSTAANDEAVQLNKVKTNLDKPNEDTRPLQETETPTEHPVEVEDEHKKELEEEEMEQAGKPERLIEEQDQVQEEQELNKPEEEDHAFEGNDEEQNEEDTNNIQGNKHIERDSTPKPQSKYRSAYEEQLEQQQLAARQMDVARRLKEQQDLLHQQRLKEHFLHQQQLHEKDLELQRQNKYKEEQLAEKLRKQAEYENADHDIVQGEEEQPIQQEEAAYERDNHQDEAEDLDAANNANEEQAMDQEAESREGQEKAVAEDVNPADDPNNQGEDEFEEAEQEREENLADENEGMRQQQDHAEVQEHLAMAVNPDQQEDNIDQQYQEEEEEERQMGAERETDLQHEDNKERNEDNYEEEEEEEDGVAGVKNKRRAEM